jgi:hypothetical protein
MPRGSGPSLVEYAITRRLAAGDSPMKAAKTGGQACATIACLAIAGHRLGRWPTQVDYAQYWKTSERTAQREWQRVEDVFGEGQLDALARHIASELGHRLADRNAQAAACSVSMPPQLLAA